jgi:hypothetical protein
VISVAKQLSSFPAMPTKRYPWEHWLDGQIWQLDKGDDYTARATTIIANARLQAKRRGGNVRTRLLRTSGNESIVLQFIVAH